MKYFNQFAIVLFIYYISVMLNKKIIHAIPATVLGMIILFILLNIKLVKPEKISDLSDFLLKDLALFFVPPGVTLIDSWVVLNENLVKILIIIVVTTTMTIIGTAKIVDFLIKRGEK